MFRLQLRPLESALIGKIWAMPKSLGVGRVLLLVNLTHWLSIWLTLPLVDCYLFFQCCSLSTLPSSPFPLPEIFSFSLFLSLVYKRTFLQFVEYQLSPRKEQMHASQFLLCNLVSTAKGNQNCRGKNHGQCQFDTNPLWLVFAYFFLVLPNLSRRWCNRRNGTQFQ